MKFNVDLTQNIVLLNLLEDVFLHVKDGNIPLEIILNKIDDCYLSLDNISKEYYKGFFDIVVSMVESNIKDLNKTKLYDECFKKTKYSFTITSILNQEDHLNHSDLAERLRMKKNQLSNIIKIVSAYKLVTSQKIGRKKYYFITSSGEGFNDYLKRKPLLNKLKQEVLV
ncbi:hypothetical protein RJI07_09125 [Mycoplasmatota bacterium WC30]